VRELQNVVHRALLLSPHDLVRAEDLPSDLTAARRPAGQRLAEIECAHILKVLGQCGGHRANAARILGITPKTLYNKLQSYGTSK
jgi:DNA-binding NtrC family response regulator